MYIAFDQDPDKDRKTRKIMFIICALIGLFSFVTCEAQVCIQHKQNTSYYTPCKSIILKQLQDTINKMSLGVYIENNKAVLYIEYYNNGLRDYQIQIGLIGNTIETLKARNFNENVNYMEFDISKDLLDKMKLYKMDYFATESKNSYKLWADVLTFPQSYFMDFLNNYNKRIDVEILENQISKF